MELSQIETYLNSTNPQDRMKAITELRHYEPSVVVPLLKQSMHDPEFMIRSFVAMGLGHKQTDEGFELLLELIKRDRDHNVRAEAANSLSKYGQRSLPHLVTLFQEDANWLVRQSIFAVIGEMESPEVLLKLCALGLQGDDLMVQRSAIANLGQLAQTSQSLPALELLLTRATSEQDIVRIQVARVLRHFDDPRAKAALLKLRQDSNYQVVGATLEGLVSM